MSRGTIKNAISNKKFLISVIIILVIVAGVLLFQRQDYKYTMLYQYQTIPDIELKNTLSEMQIGLSGEVRGFVKFDNIKDQPKDVRQYYIIKPLNKFDKDLSQYFSLEEIIKMQYLSPRSTGTSELVEANKTANTITLEDENGNQFFIDRLTREVSMRDATGDNTTLITSDTDYGKFMREWLK